MRKRRIKYLSRFTTKGIEVDQVLVRYFKYSPEIQKNIEAKKLQDQMVFTNRSAARAAKKRIRTNRLSPASCAITTANSSRQTSSYSGRE